MEFGYCICLLICNFCWVVEQAWPGPPPWWCGPSTGGPVPEPIPPQSPWRPMGGWVLQDGVVQHPVEVCLQAPSGERVWRHGVCRQLCFSQLVSPRLRQPVRCG